MIATIHLGAHAPNSPRQRIFYPSHINLFRECPQRYYLKHVLRHRVIEPFSRPLAKGVALHAVLANCFSDFREQRAFPYNLRERVEFQLQQFGYPSDLISSWDDDVRDVVGFVQWVLDRFDGTAQVLAVEETLGYAQEALPQCPAFVLRAKVDLVLAHDDGTLEHIDFKSGRAQPDAIQEVVARIVVGKSFGRNSPEIRTTTMFVAEQTVVSDVLTRSDCRDTWKTITQTVNRILTSPVWQPVPSPLCEFCPFFGNGCPIGLDDGHSDAMSHWLNGDDITK